MTTLCSSGAQKSISEQQTLSSDELQQQGIGSGSSPLSQEQESDAKSKLDRLMSDRKVQQRTLEVKVHRCV